MDSDSAPIDDAIKLLGSGAALARACGMSQPAIHKAQKANKISARLAVAIDKATDSKVPKWRSRPDLFDKPGKVA